MADRDDDAAPARSRRHQKANRAATRQRRRALRAGPGEALCALLNLVHGHPIPITYMAVPAHLLRDAGPFLRRALQEHPAPTVAALITPDAVAAHVAPYARDLVRGLRALPATWRPDLDLDTPAHRLVPFWTALKTLARVVAEAAESAADDGLIHARLRALRQEAGESGFAAIRPADPVAWWIDDAALPVVDPAAAASYETALCEHAFLHAFLTTPLTWRRRLRRCAFSQCRTPYFLDRASGRTGRTCGPVHRNAVYQQRRAEQTAWRRRGRVRRRETGAGAARAVETGRPVDTRCVSVAALVE